jgi:TPR repeat protein
VVENSPSFEVTSEVVVNSKRIFQVAALLALSRCSADGCGCHMEMRGPRTEVELRTRGPAVPIPVDKLDYVGLWTAPQMRLSIRADGGVSYVRSDGTGPVTIESTLQGFQADGFSVGQGVLAAFFRVEKPPHRDADDWKMTVDGVELLRIPNYGETALQYLNGDGVPKDEAKGMDLLGKGCDHGDMLSCAALAAAYEQGEGVEQDSVRAAKLFGKACDGGDLMSCAYLGGLHSQGRGVARDLGKALELIRRACDGNDELGCHNLAVMYDSGEGVANDDVKAAELYSRACELGKEESCQNLAIMLEDGEGVTRDPARAAELFARACEAGLSGSCRYLQKP